MPFLYKECVELAQTAVGCRVIKLPTAKRKIHEKQYCGVLKRVDTRYKVTVVWDDGTEETVQLPDQELLIYDTSAAGNRNRGVTCDACKLNDISGPRFKCLVCYDFDLCYKCYHAGKHDKSHRFSRIMYCMGWTELPERSKSSTCVVIGIMAGSKVKQGPDWPSNDDSVGKNETGKVTELIDWKDAFYDSGVKVAWEATTSKYRLGYNGNSDVQLAEEDTTLTLYQEHLLNLSEYFNFCFSMNVDQPLIGDKVIISASPSDLEKFQSEHGGYSKEMEEYRAKIGSVIQIIQSSDVVVVFTDTKRFRFNPKAMKIVKTFEEVADSFQESKKKLKIGAKVQITTDEENCKRLQRFHGEWNEMMGQFIRKVGTLIRYDNDDDAVVAFNKRTLSFIYNPTLLEAYEGKESTSDEQDFTEEMNQKNIQHNVSVSETSSFIPMVGCSVVSLSRKIESKYCVLGTISEVHTNKLMVVWSNGIKETVTADSCNTLCLYDSAVAGVTHEDKKCKTCTECPIYGTLWKCYDCMDFYLCSDCYHNNEHSLQHKFWRLAKPGDKKTLVPCRNNSTSNLVSGVLPGATVKRGLNWLWGDEDGGVGSTGKVLELKDWDDESPRSAAKIKWNNDQQKTYRAGFNGELELIVVKPNPRQCYVCHLPNLDLKGFVSEKTVSMSSKEYEPSEHIDKFGSQAIEEEEPVITSLKLPKPEVTYNLEDVFVGSRVVKGSGWEFDETRIVKKTESDIGNLKENVKMLGTVTSTDKVVMVTWDDGQDEIYDIVECRDLLLFQSAPAGIKHPGIGCNSCLATTIYGVLWSCQECNDINLCSNCYFNDKHDKDHAFYRKNNSSENRVLVAPRSEEEPGLVTGLLVGSIVQFSEDSTICSNGEKGKIISLCNLAPNYPNSGVRVKLNDGSIKTARVGFKGKVDLKVETLTSDNIPCYFQHLPTLGGKIVGTNKDEQPAQPVQKEPSVHTAPAAQTARDAQETVPDEPPVPKQNSRTSEYGSMGTNKAESPQEPADDVTIGQRVYIVGSPDNINLLYKQAEVRGFEDDNLVVYLLVEKKIIRCGRGAVMTSSQVPDEMLEQSRRQAAEAGYEFDDEEEQEDPQVISSNVEEETAPKDHVSEEQKMDAKEDENQSYVASDDRATQVNKDDGLEVGDQVKTTLAPEVLKSLQKGHGGWNSQMVQYIEEVGTVTQIDNDEDVRVHYMDGRRFYYNPAALTVFRHFGELKPTSGTEIQVGDKVSINLEEDVVRVMQEGHGGWNDDMTRLLQKVGTVIMVQQCGDLSVRFECGTAKTFNPHIFRKLTKYDASVLVAKEKQDEPKCPFKVGDKVRVISNVREAVRIQRNKGSWDFKLTAIVGKFGTVKRVSGIIVSVHFALTDKT
uniref:zinc finger protein (ZZ-type)-2 isoform X1 n=1 Tax=Ciona intestinalis TaxID=7719 RepID=UPI00089DCEF6|nr:zinc finger protein (ZZ-type)-2 isoform X1 [Ciona intestinalis]|eukprot:XP_018669408.1 zinc finger protein (ZZ-type)-2 isoform X1 [Ciona intestinalis]